MTVKARKYVSKQRRSLPSPIDVMNASDALCTTPTATTINPTMTSTALTTPSPCTISPDTWRRDVGREVNPMRKRMLSLYRLRDYEVAALTKTACPSCKTRAGSLCVWKNRISAKCIACAAVYDVARLRDLLEPYFAEQAKINYSLNAHLSDCVLLVDNLQQNIRHLRHVVANTTRPSIENMQDDAVDCDGNSIETSVGTHSDDDRVC